LKRITRGAKTWAEEGPKRLKIKSDDAKPYSQRPGKKEESGRRGGETDITSRSGKSPASMGGGGLVTTSGRTAGGGNCQSATIVLQKLIVITLTLAIRPTKRKRIKCGDK